MTTIKDLIHKYENKFPTDYNNQAEVLLNMIIKDLQSLQSSEVDVEKIMEEIKSYSISDIEEGEYIHTRITIDKLLEHLVRPVLVRHLSTSKVKEEKKCPHCGADMILEWKCLGTGEGFGCGD